MERAIVETRNLTKHYGGIEAVKEISFDVPAHSICAFLGQNGAGKSTTLRMLLGMLRPTSGSGRIFDLDIADEQQSVRIRERVGFVAEDKRLYDYMTVDEIIRFVRPLFRCWRDDLETALIERFDLPRDRKIRKLSKGMRTKLALLLGFARGGDLLILDEPTEGLDPVAIEDVLRVIVSLAAEGTTVFFSSHQIAEVEQIADHVLMMDKGEIVLDRSMDSLRNDYRHVEAVFPTAIARGDLDIPGVHRVRSNGSMVSVIAAGNIDVIIQQARAMQATSVDVSPLSLKEIFLETVGKAD